MVGYSVKKSTILIPGGSGFLGLNIAEALSNIGLSTTIMDIRKPDKSPKKSNFVFCDLSNSNEIKEVFNQFSLNGTTISSIIYCAGVDPKVNDDTENVDNFLSSDFSSINFEFSVAISGALNLVQSALPLMRIDKSNNAKSIVFIGSDLSIIAPDQRIYRDELGKQKYYKPISYSIIKHGVVGLMKYLSVELAHYEITVNCVSPGPVLHRQPNYLVENLITKIPMGRLANPEDIIGQIIFLISNQAKYLTGQNIVIDGGRSIW